MLKRVFYLFSITNASFYQWNISINMTFLKKKKKGHSGVGKDTHLYPLIPRQVKLIHNYGPRANKKSGRDEQAYRSPSAQCLSSPSSVLTLPKALMFIRNSMCQNCMQMGWNLKDSLQSMNPLEEAREETCFVWETSKESQKLGQVVGFSLKASGLFIGLRDR